MIRKILIANRGEIAHRIILTCRKKGVATVAVFAVPDRDLPFVREADEAVALKGNTPAETYLDGGRILEIAGQMKVQAIHPGYGFLSENEGFAKACREKGFIFIGPSAEAIRLMGDKQTAKRLMREAGVPVVPGYEGEDQSEERFAEEAERTGFPVLLKASAGGGGKGMRIVRKPEDLPEALQSARREAKAAFGNDKMLLEKYFDVSRHIEVQIFGDDYGNLVHMFERECSIQRRYQKIIEESPSPALEGKPELAEQIYRSAVMAGKAVKYKNAGTVEFIFTPEGEHYFLEVNTRLQVEHPVTECITGLDLVDWQLEVAQGEPLPLSQEQIRSSGHALECRLYAENPYDHFLPQTGELLMFRPFEDEQVRWDAGVEEGSAISVYFDPMIAKLITCGKNRKETVRKMLQALGKSALLGAVSNQSFLSDILAHSEFQSGDFDTKFIERNSELLNPDALGKEELYWLAITAALCEWKIRDDARTFFKSTLSGWRNSMYQMQFSEWELDGGLVKVEYQVQKDGSFMVQAGGEASVARLLSMDSKEVEVEWKGWRKIFLYKKNEKAVLLHEPNLGGHVLKSVPRFPAREEKQEKGAYVAPMPSEVVRVLVNVGDKVEKGDALVVLSSMKMENTIAAHSAGTVEEVFVEERALVDGEQMLLRVSE
ncbi:MAG: ATP-grasp domain-containing protein [Cytophagales bacterium]|nr:ATP-grasp domain-containing protein [Cytophagales bacterium]